MTKSNRISEELDLLYEIRWDRVEVSSPLTEGRMMKTLALILSATIITSGMTFVEPLEDTVPVSSTTFTGGSCGGLSPLR